MCTLALYYRVFDACPLLVAANRDERYDRLAAPPRLLKGRPAVLAGQDLSAGGTWLGVNEHGLLAAIINRRPQAPGAAALGIPRSRGLLCLDLLGCETAADARKIVRARDEVYQPFTVVVAARDAAWAAYNEQRKIKIARLGKGVHIFSNAADFGASNAKADGAQGRFERLADELKNEPLEPSAWVSGLRRVLADHALPPGTEDPRDAVCVHGDQSGTVSSAVVFGAPRPARFHFFYCSGPPCSNHFREALHLDIQ